MYTWCPESFVRVAAMFTSFLVSLLHMFEHVWIRMKYASFVVAVAHCRYRSFVCFLRGAESITFYLVLRKSSLKNADIRKTVCIYEVASRTNMSYWQKGFFSGSAERAENEICWKRSPHQTFTAAMPRLTHWMRRVSCCYLEGLKHFRWFWKYLKAKERYPIAARCAAVYPVR
jgi:hypothetical protein